MILKTKTSTLVTIILLLLWQTSAFAEMRSISSDKVNLRSGPGQNHSILWEYGKGFPVKIISKQGQWIRIRDFENDSGWVHDSLLSKKPYVIVSVNKGKNKQINIRSGPGTNYSVTGKAYYGVVFERMKQDKGWINVKHESGVEGWIERSLLWGW